MEQLYEDMWTMLEREKTQLLTRILTHWCLELNWVETTQSPISTFQEDSQLGSQESEMPSVSQETDSTSTLCRSTQSRNPPDRFGT